MRSADVGVRLWASGFALPFAPSSRSLRRILTFPRSHNVFDAEMTLEEWRRGNLQFGD